MKEKITNNLGLKFLSVLVATALWLIVINYDDPVSTALYSGIKVEIINENVLTEQGKVYEVLNDTDTVNVKVEAKRSVLDTLQQENIRAVADMNYLTHMDTLAIQVSTNKNYDRLENIYITDNSEMELKVENIKTVHLPISVVATGEPAEGYVLGDISQNQNTVRVSGPESVVSTITKAECYVSVAGRYSDVAASADIRLFNSDGERVEHDNLTTNLSAISVSATILPIKAVNIVCNVTGEPAEGYMVYGEPELDRSSVYVAARQSVTDNLWQVAIPEEVLNVDSLSENLVVKVNLAEYLPDGVRIVEEDGFDGTVQVTVNIVPLVEKAFHVPIRNLSVDNIPQGYNAEVLLQVEEGHNTEDEPVTLKVTVRGIEQELSALTDTGITGIIDIKAYKDSVGMAELPEGIYRMAVDLNIPENIEVVSGDTADVRITEIKKETTGEEE